MQNLWKLSKNFVDLQQTLLRCSSKKHLLNGNQFLLYQIKQKSLFPYRNTYHMSNNSIIRSFISDFQVIMTSENISEIALVSGIKSFSDYQKFLGQASQYMPEEQEAINKSIEKLSNSLGKFSKISDLQNAIVLILEHKQKTDEIIDNLINFLISHKNILEFKKNVLMKILTDFKETRPKSIQKFGDYLLDLVLKNNRDMSVNTYITLLYYSDLFSRNENINTPGHCSPRILQLLPSEVGYFKDNISDIESENLVYLLEFYHLRFEIPESKAALMAAILTRLSKEFTGLKPHGVATFAYILNVMKIKDKTLWQHLSDEIIIKSNEFSIYQLISLVANFAQASRMGETLLGEIVSKLKNNADQIEAEIIPVLVENLASIGGKSGDLLEALSGSISNSIKKYNMRELSVIFAGYALLHGSKQTLIEELENEIALRFSEIEIKHINNIIIALSYVDKVKSPILDHLIPVIQQNLNTPSSDLDVILTSLLSLYFKGNTQIQEILNEVVDYLSSRLDDSTIQHSTFFLNLGATLGTYSDLVKKNIKVKELGEHYLKRALKIRDENMSEMSTGDLDVLQQIIIAVSDAINC